MVGAPGTGQEPERATLGEDLQNLNKKWEGKVGPHDKISENGGGDWVGGEPRWRLLLPVNQLPCFVKKDFAWGPGALEGR